MIELDLIDLISAIALICMAIGLSLWQRLGLEFNFLIAAGRAIIQLAVLGYIFSLVLTLNNVAASLVILAIMLTISALVVRNRISAKIPYILPWVWISLLISTLLVVFYLNFAIIQPQPRYDAKYLLPLVGMVLSSAVSASAIAGERLVKVIDASSQEIETHLCLGATPQQAVSKYRRESIRAGLIPTINQMMLMGMVTIPDFVNGQLMAGVLAEDAVSYQILVLFAIALANTLATLLIVNGICRQYFNRDSQLVR